MRVLWRAKCCSRQCRTHNAREFLPSSAQRAKRGELGVRVILRPYPTATHRWTSTQILRQIDSDARRRFACKQFKGFSSHVRFATLLDRPTDTLHQVIADTEPPEAQRRMSIVRFLISPNIERSMAHYGFMRPECSATVLVRLIHKTA